MRLDLRTFAVGLFASLERYRQAAQKDPGGDQIGHAARASIAFFHEGIRTHSPDQGSQIRRQKPANAFPSNGLLSLGLIGAVAGCCQRATGRPRLVLPKCNAESMGLSPTGGEAVAEIRPDVASLSRVLADQAKLLASSATLESAPIIDD